MRRSITPVAALILCFAAPIAAASSMVLAPTIAALAMEPKGDKGKGKPDKGEKGEKGDKGEKEDKGNKGHEDKDDDDSAERKSKGHDKKAENTPHLGRALKELRLARNHLDNAKHDFGGHKANALKAIDDAIAQIQLAMKHDPESQGEAPAPNPDGTPSGAPSGGAPSGTPGGAPNGAPSDASGEKPGKGKGNEKGKGNDGESGKGKKKDK